MMETFLLFTIFAICSRVKISIYEIGDGLLLLKVSYHFTGQE